MGGTSGPPRAYWQPPRSTRGGQPRPTVRWWDRSAGQTATAVGAVWAFVFVAVFVLMKVMVTVWPKWRISKEEERIGVDIVQHGENAYS